MFIIVMPCRLRRFPSDSISLLSVPLGDCILLQSLTPKFSASAWNQGLFRNMCFSLRSRYGIYMETFSTVSLLATFFSFCDSVSQFQYHVEMQDFANSVSQCLSLAESVNFQLRTLWELFQYQMKHDAGTQAAIFYITMHFPKHHQGTCGKFHQWGTSISVALLKWIYSNSVTTWVSFTNNQFHSRFSVISVSLHLTGLMSDSVALTLLPDSLAGIASGLKRKSQQILYFLSLGSAKNLLPVVMWWFYLRSLKQLAKVYWDFFLKGGKLSLSSPKALWILAEKLRWFVQTLTSFLNFWKPSSCDACFRQHNPWMGLRKERLQSGKVRDPDAWLHWTYIREVAEPSSNSGVGHQAETDRNLEQFLVKKFCLFF